MKAAMIGRGSQPKIVTSVPPIPDPEKVVDYTFLIGQVGAITNTEATKNHDHGTIITIKMTIHERGKYLGI